MGNRLTILSLLLAGIFIAFFFIQNHTPASALTTVPTKMNFQGRLADSAGNIKANGTYNMRLKLFTVASGGTNVWSEDRLVSATQGVTVTNGTFSIQLGSITTLPASLFASGALYLEVELPTPASATTSSPVWTEGAMTPRNQMATSAYAYNAETLDGIDSAAFAQLGVNNTFTGNQTFAGATSFTGGQAFFEDGLLSYGPAILQAYSTQALQVTDGTNSLLAVDTIGYSVKVGTVDTAATLFVVDTKTTAGDPTGTNGASYYNSNTGKFRCYESGAWKDCDTGGVSSGTTAQRPGSPSEGSQFFDTTIKQMLTYANGKWQADRSTSTKIVSMGATTGCTGSVPVASATPDAADYVVTSCTSAQTTINTAITALGSQGGTVYLMEGTYIVDGSIVMNSNTRLVGAGIGTVIKVKNTFNANLNVLTNTANSAGLSIENIVVDGNKANNSSGNISGLYSFGGGSISQPSLAVSGATFRNFRNKGLELWTGNYTSITNSHFYSNSEGIYGFGNNNFIISNNQFASNTGDGINNESSTNSVISDNMFLSNNRGIYNLSNGASITGNTVKSSTNAGITVGSGMTDITIASNTIISGGTIGIIVGTNASHNIISNNTIVSNAGKGIELGIGANNNTVSSNRLRENGGSGNSAHIEIDGSYNLINDNQITDTSGNGPAISVITFGYTPVQNTLSNNTFSGTSGISDAVTTTIYSNQISSTGQLLNRATGGFAIQNSTGSNLLVADASSTKISVATVAPLTSATVGTNNTTVLPASTEYDMTLGADDFARIVYRASGGGISFIQCTNADCTSKVDTVVDATSSAGFWPSVTIGSDGFARLAYYTGAAQDLIFVQCTNASCSTKVTTTVDSTGNVGGYSDITMGLDGFVRISYADNTNSDLKFVQCTNAACSTSVITTVDSTNVVAQGQTSIAVGSDGFARIGYYDLTAASYKFAQCTNAACSSSVLTNIETENAVVASAKIILGNDTFARLVYKRTTQNDIRFVQCTNASCSTNVKTTLDDKLMPNSPSIAKGLDGFARISYQRSGTSDLRYIQCTNVSCSTNTNNVVAGSQNKGGNSRIAVGTNGFARIFHRGASDYANTLAETYLTTLSTDSGSEVRSGENLGLSRTDSFGSIYAKLLDIDGGITVDTTNHSSYGAAISINGPGEYIQVVNPANTTVFSVSDQAFAYNSGSSGFSLVNNTFLINASGTGPAAKISSSGTNTALYVDNDSGGAANLLTLDNSNTGNTPLNVTTNGKVSILSESPEIDIFSVKYNGADNLFSIDNVNHRINVGDSAGNNIGLVLVLDNKNNAGDPTGVVGAMYYNSSMGEFRCFKGSSWTNCISGQYIPLSASNYSNPTDAATTYFGNHPSQPQVTSGWSRIYFPKAGTIKMAKVYTNSTVVAGTGESWSMYIRKNNSTDSLISTVGSATAERSFDNAAINVSIAAGDYVEIKSSGPTWATNPVGVYISGYLYFE